ncbi:MAG: acyl-CoA dehydrogenase, partial [Belnapia sp.]|nr:acyl-CoA dehydrogenase [Belnapia sp.]
MIDFSLPPEVEATRARIRDFVEQRLIPLESEAASFDEHENITPELLGRMRAQAKAEGLWALGMPKERGGGGF